MATSLWVEWSTSDDFDPEEFVRNITGFGGMAAGCDHAVVFRRFTVG